MSNYHQITWHLISSGKITVLPIILRSSPVTGNLVKIAYSDKLSTVLLRRFSLNELKKGKNLDEVELLVQNAIYLFTTTEIMELFFYIRKPGGLVLLWLRCRRRILAIKSFLSTRKFTPLRLTPPS